VWRIIATHTREGREIARKEIDVGEVTIGRDATCRINLPVLCASRKHARIEFRRDKFVLTDTSTNGTYVRVDAARELVINREDFVLSGSGEISLGHSNGDGGPDLTWKVRF